MSSAFSLVEHPEHKMRCSHVTSRMARLNHLDFTAVPSKLLGAIVHAEKPGWKRRCRRKGTSWNRPDFSSNSNADGTLLPTDLRNQGSRARPKDALPEIAST